MKNRLYNLIFPIWMLIFIPMTWLIVLPANFLIDSLILLLSLFLFVKSNYWMIYKQTILKIWGFGFLSRPKMAALFSSIMRWSQVRNGSHSAPFSIT